MAVANLAASPSRQSPGLPQAQGGRGAPTGSGGGDRLALASTPGKQLSQRGVRRLACGAGVLARVPRGGPKTRRVRSPLGHAEQAIEGRKSEEAGGWMPRSHSTFFLVLARCSDGLLLSRVPSRNQSINPTLSLYFYSVVLSVSPSLLLSLALSFYRFSRKLSLAVPHPSPSKMGVGAAPMYTALTGDNKK